MSEHNFAELAEDRGKRFVQEDSYVLVLLLILASIISSAILGGRIASVLVPLAFMSLTLVVALSTSGAGPRTRRVGRIAVLVAFLLVAVAAVANFDALARLAFFIVAIALSLATPVVIARRLWKHPKVSTNTIAGAADIYLLIGLLFAVIYSLIGAVQADALDAIARSGAQTVTPYTAFFYSGRPTGPSDFIYFSFTTLTTVGYGDLTATSAIGRLLSNIEALIGQLYLVTVVAVLVSNIGASRRSSASDSVGEE